MHGLTSFRTVLGLSCIVLGGLVASAQGADPLEGLSTPLVIGHRGACGYRPEHTLASYELAIDQGADFPEPDLVITKDGVLICRHDVEIGGSTDVAQKFPDRKHKVTIDGQELDGWFANDFTLAEIKTLKAREPFVFRNHAYDGQFEIATFDEYLDLVERKTKETGRVIGIIPEVKNSTYHIACGLAIEDRLVKVLRGRGYPNPKKPCIIQSFEVASLKELAGKIDVPLLQLVANARYRPPDVLAQGGKLTYGEMMTPAGLAEVAKYAWGVSVAKESILPRDPQGKLGKPNSWIEDAHHAGLKIIAYTFRRESHFLARDYHGQLKAEADRWYQMGIDGIFADNPDICVQARKALKK